MAQVYIDFNVLQQTTSTKAMAPAVGLSNDVPEPLSTADAAYTCYIVCLMFVQSTITWQRLQRPFSIVQWFVWYSRLSPGLGVVLVDPILNMYIVV